MIEEAKLIYHPDRVISKKPILMEAILTNKCNHHCCYCRRSREKEKGDFWLSAPSFDLILARAKELGIKAIILTGGGEPLMDPDIDSIIKGLEKHEIPYGVNSNFQIYQRMNPHWLKVSMDAPDDETYSFIRNIPKGSLEQVKENLRRLSKECPKVKIGIQAIVWEKGQVTQFYNAHVNRTCFNYMVFRPLESVKPFEGDVEAIVAEIDSLQIKDRRVVKNYKWSYMGKRWNKCLAAWSVLTVDWFGRIWYCCHKPWDIIGSIFDGDIMRKKIAWESDMSRCEVPCRLTGNNAYLERLNNPDGEENFI